MSSEQDHALARRSLTSAVMVVVGSVIGSGIFLTPQNVAANVDVPGLMIGVWVLTGLLTLAGTSHAEVASLIPEAGGQYVFFRVTFGQLTAFLYGWTTFIVYQTGSIAAIAVAFAKYLGYFVDLPNLGPELEALKLPLVGNICPLKDIGVTMVAIGAIVTVTTINYFGVQFGGMIQNVFTFMKVLALDGIIVLAFGSGKGDAAHFFPLWGTPSSGDLFAAVGVATIATLWSYDGWNSLTYLAGEVKEPQKTIPRALITGTLIVIVIYVATNMAYLYILPIGQIAQSRLVAADVMNVIFHGWGARHHLGHGHGLHVRHGQRHLHDNSTGLLRDGEDRCSSARSERSIPRSAPRRNRSWCRGPGPPSSVSPERTIRSSPTSSSPAGFFYALGAAAVFILPRQTAERERAYRVPLYPVIPVLFILVATWFVYNTVVQQTADSMVGLLLLVAGIPFYLYWQRQMTKA